jgi:hypothetical protein
MQWKTLAKEQWLVAVAMTIGGCSSHGAVRVRCDSHLEPINLGQAAPPLSGASAGPMRREVEARDELR